MGFGFEKHSLWEICHRIQIQEVYPWKRSQYMFKEWCNYWVVLSLLIGDCRTQPKEPKRTQKNLISLRYKLQRGGFAWMQPAGWGRLPDLMNHLGQTQPQALPTTSHSWKAEGGIPRCEGHPGRWGANLLITAVPWRVTSGFIRDSLQNAALMKVYNRVV